MNKLLIATLLALGGCASPQAVYYTLTPVNDQLASTNASSAASVKASNSSRKVPYKLERVTVPPQSDDLSLVVRDGNDRLMVLTYDRWTVSLSDELNEALALTLTDEIGIPPVQAWSSFAKKLPHNEIQVDIRRFEMLPGQSAILSASWHIKFSHAAKGKSKTSSNVTTRIEPNSATETSLVISELTCFASFSHVAKPGVLQLVQAQQKNIRQLSYKIAQTLKAGQGVEGIVCQ
jgi:uncharacterized lipoprotein YmbA